MNISSIARTMLIAHNVCGFRIVLGAASSLHLRPRVSSFSTAFTGHRYDHNANHRTQITNISPVRDITQRGRVILKMAVKRSKFTSKTSSSDPDNPDTNLSGYKRPSINWFPGHIASATASLSATLKRVDVVVEVRDARIPSATSHPRVAEWAAGRPRVVAITRIDLATASSLSSWMEAYAAMGGGFSDGEMDGDAINR
eukprot:CAMPEP_0113325578 /NCGR_PEP_ID=MMETSP0010_2-20120614/17864_1 /TAXON_ID=216773 ORGANISM="Corethron hystrix, Strain 308" /NCGR_SAMPLE_ID=MMETSP0010_2 /ASSEMBLY_ACC=CAM_ASM_000155 /LENGTH=198 /DNA_ID=CAMNT_0000185455 /DNA_START=102 /DNA_END=694 /DNA_ORIENTATION=+ /assembly_acc=CAM_ASM_000155